MDRLDGRTITSENVFDNESEREHFQAVLQAYRLYESYSLQRVVRSELVISSLSIRHQEHLIRMREGLTQTRKAICDNARLLALLIQDAEGIFENVPSEAVKGTNTSSTSPDSSDARGAPRLPPLHNKSTDVDKVQSVLKQLVRDWSELGAVERQQCYQPILDELALEFPNPQGVSVLVPGAGLGRLAFEIARQGFSCEGNEVSLYMLFASNFIFNKCHTVNQHTVQPWAHQYVNNMSYSDQLAKAHFPDTSPAVLAGSDFSMIAGDFLKVYTTPCQWECVATCFFIDCAPNVIDFIEAIYLNLKPGGIWINLGPLLYHYSDMANEDSIEPPFDILCDIIKEAGFIMEKCKTGVKTRYAQNPSSMLQYEYNSVYFVCRKPSMENGCSQDEEQP